MSRNYVFSKYALLATTLLFLVAGVILWQAWPGLMLSSMQWQKGINKQLSDLLFQAQNHLYSAGASLMLLSFVYGALHSLGPGHGKLIVSTYVATHPTKVKISLILTVLSALLQAVVAIILVSTLLIVFGVSMREINGEANHLISVSFYIVILLGIIIVVRNARLLFKTIPPKKKTLQIHSLRPLTNNKVSNVANGNHDSHANHDSCGCGHVHFASANDINNASSLKEYLAIIFSVGLRPCTGAIMVLLFSHVLNIYWLGIASAFAMGLGTALTTSVIAIMTVTGKKLVSHYMQDKAPHRDNHQGISVEGIKRQFVTTLIKLVGGAILIFIGTVLVNSQPTGISPIF